MWTKLQSSSYSIISPSLNSSQYELLKLIGILSMLTDHIGYIFFPETTISHIFGRLAMPIFSFLLVYSYFNHTSNKLHYILRIFIVAIIAQAPYTIVFQQSGPMFLNILFTLSFGLLIIYIIDKFILDNSNILMKYLYGYLLIAFFMAAGMFIDYIHFGLMLIISYWAWFRFPSANTLYLAIIVTVFLNIVSGYWYVIATVSFFGLTILAEMTTIKIRRVNKWFFYVFYPAHIIILHIISLV